MSRLLSLLVTASLPMFAYSQTVMAQGGDMPELPEAIKELSDRGAQTRYLGTKHGMDGWITIYQGQEQYYYVTPDKKGFVMGVLFDEDGRMATVDQVRDLQAQGDDVLDMLTSETAEASKMRDNTRDISEVSAEFEYRSPAERMFADVQNANSIALGANKDAPVIYSFIDPQCSHCHEFIKDMKADYLDKGLLQIRIIPVGFRDETLAQSAILLASQDAEDRFYAHLRGDEQALPVTTSLSTQGVQKNLALMQAWKFNVTPLNVYMSKDDEIKIIRGRAKDPAALLADLPNAG